MKQQKKWYDYLWVFSPIYLSLGCFNILFAWLGLSRKKDMPQSWCVYCSMGTMTQLICKGKAGAAARARIKE